MYSPSSVVHDFRYAIRLLRNSPGFSAVAIATIALAIGANTAMFSFVNGVLLSPLPYPESDRIVRVLEQPPNGGPTGISTLNYLDWANQNAAFDYMAAEVGWRATLTGRGEPVSIRGARLSAHYFDIFGVKPALGRTFLPGEDQVGHDRVVLLSHVLWENRFGSDPALLGRDLLMRSFFKLLDVDPGFNATNVLTAGLPIIQEQHRDSVELNAYLASISAAVEAVPGVRETAMTSALPLQGWGYGVPYSIAGRELTDPANRRTAFFKIVSPSYFNALGIRLLAGRLLSDHDMAAAPPVALINETLARREFPDENPIGHRILVQEIVPGKTEFGQEIAWEIVGVIAGERITGLGDAISAGMYVSNQQSPTYGINFIVRAGMPPESLQRSVRSAVDSVNRDQALSDVRTLEQIMDQSMLANRVVNTLLAAFASMALLLAAVGIYGVISYTAVQRTHEMGIRAALGASAGNLRMLILRGGMRLALFGLAIGLAATIPTTDVMSSMLYGVQAYDPLTISVVGAVLFGVAGLACFLPARRVTKVDPMEALRRQ